MYEVLRARADRVDYVIHRAVRSDHDDRQLRLAIANVRQDLDSILARQRQIQQNQVEGLLINFYQSRFAIDRRFDGVTFQRKQCLQRFADTRFVINDQDAVLVLSDSGRKSYAESGCFQTFTVFLTIGNSK